LNMAKTRMRIAQELFTPGAGNARPEGFREEAKRVRRFIRLGTALPLVALLWPNLASVSWPQTNQAQYNARSNLKQLTLEELMSIEITSVAKKEQRWLETATAIFVITQEDIQRSGVTSIPEALRLAPGVVVNRANSSQWVVGIRGLGSVLARSVLVLIDGRSVYTPLFGGVYWDVQDTLIEDIDRIEVIRGPGGTIWGANAVNGVINIITKNARSTHGLLLTAGTGSEEKGFGGFRYGGVAGQGFNYRVYGKGFRRDAQYTPHVDDFDDWQMGRAGFRTDWDFLGRNDFTVQGDIYKGYAGQRTSVTQFTAPFSTIVERNADLSGMNLLGRWKRAISGTSDATLQIYYDQTFRREATYRERRNTADVDFQHRFRWPKAQEITWGLGYRFTSGDTESVPSVFVSPQNRSDNLFTAFVQHEFTILENLLRLTVGSKFEHNDYTGFEFQPSIRALWTPGEYHSVWASISRAVRTPSRVEHDASLTAAPSPTLPIFLRVLGDEDFTSERVMAYELGYRVQPADNLFADLAGFYNRYDRLLSLEPGPPFVEPPGLLIFPFAVDNKLKANVYGVELAVDWRWREWWRLRAAYSYQRIDTRTRQGSGDNITGPVTEGSSPHNQLSLLSFIDLPARFKLDGVFRYVDNIPMQNVPRYFNLDLRLGWNPTRHLEFSLVGQNLLQAHHAEWSGGTEIQRGVYTKATWRW
jgi:iron complex outermembrane receptor protein